MKNNRAKKETTRNMMPKRRSAGASRLRNALSACSGKERTNARLLAGLDDEDLARLEHDWQVWAREDQLPPPGEWVNWLVLGGRGAGKTRTGAEWVRGMALGLAGFSSRPVRRIALIGETLEDVRSVMIEGESGLLGVHPESERPHFESSKRQLLWPNGTVAQMFSGNRPEPLRVYRRLVTSFQATISNC